MYWTNRDKVLFSIVNTFGKQGLEKQIEDATEAFYKLKKRPDFFVVFGYYDIKNNLFVWQSNMNTISYNTVIKSYMPLFGSDKTVKKLFEQTVQFDAANMNVIPYLMEALNAAYSVIRIKNKDYLVYALVKLDTIEETFNYENFNDAMMLYRKWNELGEKTNKVHKKHYKRKHHTRKQKRRV